jgi:hypothetical protein
MYLPMYSSKAELEEYFHLVTQMDVTGFDRE